MRLIIKNFQKIKEANIKIDGLTLVAGKNDTGKSTVSKWLYSILLSSFGKRKILEEDKVKMFQRFLRVKASDLVKERGELKPKNINELLDLAYDISDSQPEEIVLEDIMKKIENISQKGTKLYGEIENYLKKQDEDILKDNMLAKVMSKIIFNEFDSQLTNESKVEFENSEGNRIFTFKKIKNELKMHFETIEMNLLSSMNSFYIETPFILERSKIPLSFNGDFMARLPFHSNNLFKELYKGSPQNVLEDEERHKLHEVTEEINKIIDGKLTFDNTNHEIEFENNSGEKYGLLNIATGIKSLGIIQRLLQNESITKNSIVIIDEPEVHLHPEWQVKFSNIILLLHKRLDIKFYINTHSPYIIEAMGVFADENNVEIDYYLAEKVEKQAVFKEIKEENLSEIYKSLSEPYEYLDRVKFGLD